MIREGTGGGAAFYLIVSGEASVTIGGEQRAILRAGDYFGEIALIDEGARIATITAASELVCQGLTLWEFRPLVEENGRIAWTLLQTLSRELRAAEQALASLQKSGRHPYTEFDERSDEELLAELSETLGAGFETWPETDERTG